MNKFYGFEQEVISKYDSSVYEAFIRLFYSLTLAHCINHEILVVHGGLFSRDGVTLDDIRKIKRFREVPENGIMCELLWSDPTKINGRHPSNRGVAITFGPDVVNEFLKKINYKNWSEVMNVKVKDMKLWEMLLLFLVLLIIVIVWGIKEL